MPPILFFFHNVRSGCGGTPINNNNALLHIAADKFGKTASYIKAEASLNSSLEKKTTASTDIHRRKVNVYGNQTEDVGTDRQ